ncbi:ATP-binding protein [Niveibacterium umoris]
MTIVTVTLAAGGLGIGMLVFRAATGQAEEVFDGQLVQTAELIATLTDSAALRHTPPSRDEGDDDEEAEPSTGDDDWVALGAPRFRQRVVYQVWRSGAIPRLLARSTNAPEQALPVAAAGFSERTWEGARWRFYRLERKDHVVIVGQDATVRERLAEEIGEHGVPLFALGFAVAILLTWGAIVLGLRPLARLSRDLEHRAHDRLDPISPAARPRELEVLVAALNGLFERVARAFANERRFTADAAHELRTPLAALAAQIQSAQSAGDEATRLSRLQQALDGTQRMARLVEQLLAAARLDALDTAARETVDVALLTRELAAEMAASALARDVELALESPEHLAARVQPDLVRALLRNLIDNAVRHAPRGSVVTIGVTRDSDRVSLMVRDEGAGMDDALRARAGERFLRGAADDATGAGLGLSIVRRIAALHEGEVRFETAAAGGLLVTAQLKG